MTTPTAPAGPTTRCWPSIRGTALRLTALDRCGRVLYGPKASLVTDGFITASLSPQNNTGTEISVVKANGQVCVYDKAPDTLKSFTVKLVLCNVNPALLGMLAGYEQVLDHGGAAVGNRISEDPPVDGAAVEIWSDIVGAECAADADGTWGYSLLPRTTGWAISGDIEYGNSAVNVELTGNTKKGAVWGTGPYNVVGTGSTGATPGKLLTPIGSKDHYHLQLTGIAPPEPDEDDCGATALTA